MHLHMQAGVATHRALPDKADAQRAIRKATCHEPYIGHKQLMAYHLCLLEFGHRHQWMGEPGLLFHSACLRVPSNSCSVPQCPPPSPAQQNNSNIAH
jgi:hypothetical protein